MTRIGITGMGLLGSKHVGKIEPVIMHDSHPGGERTVLSGPGHPGQAGLWPGPGVGLGLEDMVGIQAAAMIRYMETGEGRVPTFEDARCVADAQQAMVDSGAAGAWNRISGREWGT